MLFRLEYGLPCVAATLTFRGQQITLQNVVLDSGSARTVFAADPLQGIGLIPEGDDIIRLIHGVGGTETVFSKQLDALDVGNVHIENFDIEVAAMQYGFGIDGILGMDFLLQIRAVLNFANLTLTAAP